MSEPKTRILVVDDDLRLRDLLQRYLTEQGFGVHTVPDAAGMDKLLGRERVDLLVRRLRGGKNTVPIIMLTAKGEDVDRIVGLEMGADDYLPKPFNPRELVARIHAVLRRRVAPLPPGAPAVEPEKVSFGNMTINLATRTLERDGQSLSLTTGEFALLRVLVTNPRTPLSRDKLMELARGREYEVFDRSIDVQVSRLRAALVVATTAAWFAIFRASEIEPRARQISQNLVSIVNITRTALVNSQPELRRELLSELAEREGIQVYTAEPGEHLAPPADRPVLNLALELARQQLGEGTRFAGEREGKPGLWLSFHIDDDEYWLRIPRERIERQIALRWLGWGALALVLSLLAAYFLVSRLNRPLRALAEGAGAIGKGKMPEPVPESGPEEIATLSHAFNQMSKDLARLDADRALILAGVSHDLRTPLSRLRLGLEMSGADPQLREGMTADIEEMDRTINQFLDFARTDGGEPPQSADLAAIAAEVSEHYRRRGKTIATDFSRVPELPLQVMSMRRVVLNLIDNALRYGEKEVSVAVRAEDGAAVLEVADRGPGIPQSEAERLKQPFTRLEVARSDKGGAGLGLAIVERVVRAHRGGFELLAREGGGLVARIRLPS